MKIKNLVATEVAVVSMDELTVGSAYKRIDSGTYGGTKIKMGIVTDILTGTNENGEVHIAVTAVEYPTESELTYDTPVVRAFSGEEDLMIHPIQPHEVDDLLAKAMGRAERSVKTAELELESKQKHYDTLRKVEERLRLDRNRDPWEVTQ